MATSTFILRDRRGTYGTGMALVARLGAVSVRVAAAFCVASVALNNIHRHFAWQAWHLATSTFILHGRRFTFGTGLALLARLGAAAAALCVALGACVAPALCVAGVALSDIHLHSAWQVWHLATSTFILLGTRGTFDTGLIWCDRRGTWPHPPSFAWLFGV